jgi:hypothetical protein
VEVKSRGKCNVRNRRSSGNPVSQESAGIENAVTRLLPFTIKELIELFDERRKFVVILFGCDLCSQFSQPLSDAVIALH